MRLLKKIIPILFICAFATVTLDGCWIFHKNKCGDCPNFSKGAKVKKGKHQH